MSWEQEYHIWETWIKELNPTEKELKTLKAITDNFLRVSTKRDIYMILFSIRKLSEETEKINKILILNGQPESDLTLSERLEDLVTCLKRETL